MNTHTTIALVTGAGRPRGIGFEVARQLGAKWLQDHSHWFMVCSLVSLTFPAEILISHRLPPGV